MPGLNAPPCRPSDLRSSVYSFRNRMLPNGNPTVPKAQGDFKHIDISGICRRVPCTCPPGSIRIFIHSVGENTPLPLVPMSAEEIIRESDMSLSEAQDYVGICRIYAFYLECAPVARFDSPDVFFLHRLPALPRGKGIFDFMDPAITPLEEIAWPDLEKIYRI